MKRLVTLTIAFALSTVCAVAQGRPDGAEAGFSYKEMAIFNQVAGRMRFVGNFVARPGRCDVTLFETGADNRQLAPPLRGMLLTIAAGTQSRIDGGSEAALAIACKTRGDEIAVWPEPAQISGSPDLQ